MTNHHPAVRNALGSYTDASLIAEVESRGYRVERAGACDHGANYGLPNSQRRCLLCNADFAPRPEDALPPGFEPPARPLTGPQDTPLAVSRPSWAATQGG
jgi:hypothetical protein